MYPGRVNITEHVNAPALRLFCSNVNVRFVVGSQGAKEINMLIYLIIFISQ